MKKITQKFRIERTDKGLMIESGDGTRLAFTPVEALMLLDILKNEESALQEMAEASSPLPTGLTPS